MIFKKYIEKKYTVLSPFLRKIILIIFDGLTIILSGLFTNFFIVGDFLSLKDSQNFYILFFYILFAIPFYIFTNQYRSLTRYIKEKSIFEFAVRNFSIIFLIITLYKIFTDYQVSFRFYFLFFILISISQTFMRYMIKNILNYIYNPTKSSSKLKDENVVIYGANKQGYHFSNLLLNTSKLNILFFIDDDPYLKNLSLNGIRIKPMGEFKNYKNSISKVFISLSSNEKEKLEKIYSFFKRIGIEVYQIPSIEKITSGEFKINKIKPINIENILGRESISPNKELIDYGVKRKNICITGGGGSIGSEICRQIIKHYPNKLIIIDSCEENLYLLEKELNSEFKNKLEIKFILDNVCHENRFRNILFTEKIDIIFHAAAYKHVPIVELNPMPSLINNILSTEVVCKSAKSTNVKQVVLISSDKAVRPTNIMGASKRVSELIVQGYADNEERSTTDKKIFSMVRFGNVMGSSGSVIPLFQKQIEQGKPITITHPEVIRYFMTIPEASGLVLQAAGLSKGGEIFLLDMGKAIKIIDLARKILKIYGLKEKQSNGIGDVEITTIGLRPGEKLYEELLIDGKSEKTTHPLIFKAKDKFISLEEIQPLIKKLYNFSNNGDLENSLKTLKEIVPDWVKRN